MSLLSLKDDEKPAVASEERPACPLDQSTPILHGGVFPNKCKMFLTGLSDSELYASKLSYWTDVHGFKMSALRQSVLEEGMIRVVAGEKIVTLPAEIAQFDLMRVKIQDLDFESRFQLKFTRKCQMHAIVGYFDIDFEAEEHPVHFNTSPGDTPTHWKQAVFWLNQPLDLSKDAQQVNGRIVVKKSQNDSRALDIAIWLYGATYDEVIRKQSFIL